MSASDPRQAGAATRAAPPAGPARGADLVAGALVDAGVTRVFALSGNHLMPLFDALVDSPIEIVHVRHEAAAVHMADAWGRLTGEAGVAMVTGGPGHANAVGAFYTALAADSPLVLLSGHAPLSELGRGAFQEMAQADLARPLVKAAWCAQSAQSLGGEVERALGLARAQRPGPVSLSLPSDLLESPAHGAERARRADARNPSLAGQHPDLAARGPALASRDHGSLADDPRLAHCLAALEQARRPLLVAGPAFAPARARARLAQFSDRTAIPALVMESPRGVNDPALGALAEALGLADLVVLLAKPLDFTLRFGGSPTLAPGARVAAIDADEASLARSARVAGARLAAGLRADPWRALDAIEAASRARATDANRAWRDEVARLAAWRPPQWAALASAPGQALHPLELGRAVQRWIDRNPDTVFVCDGGEVGQWTQAAVHAGERLINGVAGAIGAAIPLAIGARAARPGAPVLAVMGDGTFGFHMAEFDTALRHGLPFVAVVGNDSRWNAEYQIQLREYGAGRAHGCELAPGTRYEKVVEALGGHGEYVEDGAGLDAAIERAFASGRPACVNVRVASVAAPVMKHAS